MSDRFRDTVLDIRNLSVEFPTETDLVKAVSGLTFQLERGQTIGIVGESGSGKSVTSQAVMGLIPSPGRVTSGEIWLKTSATTEPINLLAIPEKQLRRYRGGEMAVIFQEPMSALNPVYTIGYQIVEAIRQHQTVTVAEAQQQAIERLQEVKLVADETTLRDQVSQELEAQDGVTSKRDILKRVAQIKQDWLDRYPHQLSGGQLQRVTIAMAIASNPTLLIADEPTTALDVTVQATILALLRELRDRHQMSMMFVSHDLGVIAEVADVVAVMYRGELVEVGTVDRIFSAPQHPYTKGLIACRPQLDRRMRCLPTVADFMEVVTNAAGESEIVERTPDVSVFGEMLGEPIAVIGSGVMPNDRSRSDLARIRSILEEGNDPEAIIQSEASNHAEEITDPEVSNISEAIDAQIEDQAEDNSTTVDPGSEVENSAVESSEAENSEAESSETEEPIEPIAAETENPSPDWPSAEQPVTDQVAIERLSAIASQPLDTDDDRFNLDNFDLDTPADRLDTGILKLNSGFAAPVESEEIGEIDEPKPSNTPLTDLEVARRLAYLQRQPPLLEVEHLKVGFPQRGLFGRARRYTMAVNDVSFQVFPGETLGLVGESGCGKSTLARTLMRLIDPLAGKIRFEDRDILALKPQALRFLRRDMQTIFQDPGNALNPRMSVGAAILEPMQIHNFGASKKERLDRVKYLLDRVDLDISAINRYPHEFSGGQRQRICIARALALEPKFVICDESVSALDVSVQAQVLNLLKELQEEFGLTYIFISHDLSVVKFMSDRIMVMNQGQIEEIGPADRVYRHPERDYTRKLIASIPRGHISDRAAS
jgi:ABC-type glutathione transport system ATPase component